MSTTQTIIDEYVDFLRRHRALEEGSIRVILRHVTPFLLHLGDQALPSRLKEVSPAVVRRFVVARAESQKRSGKRAVCFAMRSFLRYASMRGYVERARQLPHVFARSARKDPKRTVTVSN